MNISICHKGNSVYARFRDSKNGYKELHLPPRLNYAIHLLQYAFKNRQYIERGLATEQDLEQLIQRLRDNLK